MPRASWRGFLRLSLVSCPIYLSPATTRTKPIRLHRVWQPAPVDMDEDDLPDRGGGQQGSAPSIRPLLADNGSSDEDQTPVATRITLRPHDPGTGEEIDKREVLKGYEYSRQFLTFTADELKALDVESTRIVDLEKFVPGSNIDPVYFDSPLRVSESFWTRASLLLPGDGSKAGHLLSGRIRSPGDRAERADQGVICGKPVPGCLAGIHDVRQAGKHRIGQPMAAQIVPNPLDRVELRAVRRQLQQGDIAGHRQALAPVPAGAIQDHHGMRIGGDLAADLAEVMVHRGGIADRHD